MTAEQFASLDIRVASDGKVKIHVPTSPALVVAAVLVGVGLFLRWN